MEGLSLALFHLFFLFPSAFSLAYSNARYNSPLKRTIRTMEGGKFTLQCPTQENMDDLKSLAFKFTPYKKRVANKDRWFNTTTTHHTIDLHQQALTIKDITKEYNGTFNCVAMLANDRYVISDDIRVIPEERDTFCERTFQLSKKIEADVYNSITQASVTLSWKTNLVACIRYLTIFYKSPNDEKFAVIADYHVPSSTMRTIVTIDHQGDHLKNPHYKDIYVFKIRATIHGLKTYETNTSNTVVVKFIDVPEVPSLFVEIINATIADVSWKYASKVTGFQLRWHSIDGINQTNINERTARKFRLTNLKPATRYKLEMNAILQTDSGLRRQSKPQSTIFYTPGEHAHDHHHIIQPSTRDSDLRTIIKGFHEKEDSHMMFLVGGAVVGILVIVVIVAFFVCLLHRQKLRQRESERRLRKELENELRRRESELPRKLVGCEVSSSCTTSHTNVCDGGRGPMITPPPMYGYGYMPNHVRPYEHIPNDMCAAYVTSGSENSGSVHTDSESRSPPPIPFHTLPGLRNGPAKPGMQSFESYDSAASEPIMQLQPLVLPSTRLGRPDLIPSRTLPVLETPLVEDSEPKEKKGLSSFGRIGNTPVNRTSVHYAAEDPSSASLLGNEIHGRRAYPNFPPPPLRCIKKQKTAYPEGYHA